MDIREMAMGLWPMWMMGSIMVFLVWNSPYRKELRVDAKGLLRFGKWIALLTLFRFFLFKFLASPEMIEGIRNTAHFLPWQGTLGVFWEDACHTLPLVLLAKMFSKQTWHKWLSKPLLWTVMFSFGSGHMYQGPIACMVLAFYIPITMRLAKKYGFGTIMLCHIAYDLITLLSMKLFTGA